MDEFYLVNLGAEVTRGMTEKASRGEPVSIAPFGYILKDGNYYPDEESGKAEIVREIFRLYASGVKIREIAVMLGERGIRTRLIENVIKVRQRATSTRCNYRHLHKLRNLPCKCKIKALLGSVGIH